ncbi:MAG: hypothetical protein PHC71_00945 [Candidatus Omnitrophica bacterium]|nr:hypothetical protein [Candidatus Omnitrophota bacterium]
MLLKIKADIKNTSQYLPIENISFFRLGLTSGSFFFKRMADQKNKDVVTSRKSIESAWLKGFNWPSE